MAMLRRGYHNLLTGWQRLKEKMAANVKKPPKGKRADPLGQREIKV